MYSAARHAGGSVAPSSNCSDRTTRRCRGWRGRSWTASTSGWRPESSVSAVEELHQRLEVRHAFRRGLERLAFLAEGKADVLARVLAVVIETRSRYGRHAALSREPEREVDVAQVAQLGKIGQDVIRAFGQRELESGRGQGLDDQVTAEPVVACQMIEILGVERIADRGGGLERRGCADGQKVVDLPNRVRRLGRGDRVAQAPSRATECLRQTGDGDRPLAHTRPRSDGVMLARVRDVFVRV